MVTAEKGYKGISMEGAIAKWYEKNTRKDMAEFRKLAGQLQATLPRGGDVLEVAPGPGFLAIEMAKGGKCRVTGLDVSKTFVDLARKNAANAGVRVDFRQGNASFIPFEDNSFDLVVCRAAFKNFSKPVEALREMRRVLRPGSAGVVIDLRHDTPMQEIRRYVSGLGLSAINRWITIFTFRFMLLKRAYTKQQFEQMLEQIPFAKAEVRDAPLGVEVWFEK